MLFSLEENWPQGQDLRLSHAHQTCFWVFFLGQAESWLLFNHTAMKRLKRNKKLDAHLWRDFLKFTAGNYRTAGSWSRTSLAFLLNSVTTWQCLAVHLLFPSVGYLLFFLLPLLVTCLLNLLIWNPRTALLASSMFHGFAQFLFGLPFPLPSPC